MVELAQLTAQPRVKGKRQQPVRTQDKETMLLEQAAENIPNEIFTEDLFDSEAAQTLGYHKIESSDGIEHKAEVTHVRPGRVVMFKQDRETGRVFRRIVPAKNMLMNVRNGWLMRCPDCGTDCHPNPNECPDRKASGEFKLNTRCPVCNKRFFDAGPLPVTAAGSNDAGFVQFDDLVDSPESRIRAMRDEHILGFHPSIARRMGLKDNQSNEG